MKNFLFTSFLLLYSLAGSAQTALRIEEAEQALIKNNLLLLAEQFNITAAQAAVIQSRIWERPYLSGEINAVNPQRQKTFDIGPAGQKSVAIQQLIYLGGKKRNEINFAKSNVAIAELQFEQLIRNLKFQLAQNFYGIYFDQRKILTLDFQINRLDTLLQSYHVQSDKGNIALKEVIRLQTLVLGLKNDRNSIAKEVIQQQQEISLITGLTETLDPIVEADVIIKKYDVPKVTIEDSYAIAETKNPEYLTALRIYDSQDLFLRWQRSLAVPDVTTGLSYDQRGGAFQNQTNITIGIPIPLWNRNKGNIKMAEAQLLQSNFNKQYKKQELHNRIESAWLLWQQQRKQLNSISNSVNQNLETVYQGVLNNFQKRNITLLEFTDFMESYNQTIIQINDIKKQWILSGITINYVTNTDVF